MNQILASAKVAEAERKLEALRRRKARREETARMTGRHQWDGPAYESSIATQDAEIRRAERSLRAHQARATKVAA